jgi:hypothetical protein
MAKFSLVFPHVLDGNPAEADFLAGKPSWAWFLSWAGMRPESTYYETSCRLCKTSNLRRSYLQIRGLVRLRQDSWTRTYATSSNPFSPRQKRA